MAIQHLSSATFDETVQGQNLTLVDFWAEWCGPCKMLGPVMDTLAQQYEGQAMVAKVNVDEAGDIAQRFGVMSIPTVVVLKNGVEVDRKVGVMPANIYEGLIEVHK